jgi:trk system potassium uptake protein TrkA
MRAVFIGAGELSCMTARQLLEKRYEVVVIEQDKARIDELGRDMDVGFIHGDGSKPAILREADPTATDFLFCLCGTDQYNIIASLVGRSLGYRRVITRIEDPSYEHICIELGLEDIIIPDFTIARHLGDLCEGQDSLELSALLKGDARVFAFVASRADEGPLADLNPPKGSSLMFLYRDDKLMLPELETTVREGDEVLIISHAKVIPELQARWKPLPSESNTASEA